MKTEKSKYNVINDSLFYKNNNSIMTKCYTMANTRHINSMQVLLMFLKKLFISLIFFNSENIPTHRKVERIIQ